MKTFTLATPKLSYTKESIDVGALKYFNLNYFKKSNETLISYWNINNVLVQNVTQHALATCHPLPATHHPRKRPAAPDNVDRYSVLYWLPYL